MFFADTFQAELMMPVVLVFFYLKDKVKKDTCPEMSIWAKGHNNLFFINANNFLIKD